MSAVVGCIACMLNGCASPAGMHSLSHDEKDVIRGILGNSQVMDPIESTDALPAVIERCSDSVVRLETQFVYDRYQYPKLVWGNLKRAIRTFPELKSLVALPLSVVIGWVPMGKPALGTGFVIGSSAERIFVLTCAHAVGSNVKSVRVRHPSFDKATDASSHDTDSTTRMPTHIVWRDPSVDAALLRIDVPLSSEDEVASIPLGVSADTRVGTSIIIIGYPGGPPARNKNVLRQPSTRVGIVSSLEYTLKGGGVLDRVKPGFIKADTYADNGSSGGPMLNSNGNVIGLFAARVGHFSLSVPIDPIRDSLLEFVSTHQEN